MRAGLGSRAGAAVSLAVAVAAAGAVVTPAAATGGSARPVASHGAADPCKPGRPGPDDPCDGGGPTPPPGAACGPAVDSTQPNGNEEYLGALYQGVPFAGRRDVAPDPENTVVTSGPADAVGWDDLSDVAGFPGDSPVCDISVAANGSDVFYKIITLDGDVYTLHCDGSGQALVCPAPAQGQIPPSQWREVTDLPNSP
ncbi:hypothetical protein ACIF8T_13635 [Streptomyces sp. NPDC085946]|uniref:hypothetical protein n=1 Tax=Streptomyces sp. NPDC085946 TaxID=3365744 RepID=UPI0037D246C4